MFLILIYYILIRLIKENTVCPSILNELLNNPTLSFKEPISISIIKVKMFAAGGHLTFWDCLANI